MTELVVGKKLQVPNVKDFANLATFVATGQHNSKMKVTLPEVFVPSVATSKRGIHRQICNDPLLATSIADVVSETSEQIDKEPITNARETKHSLPSIQAHAVESVDSQNPSRVSSNEVKMTHSDSESFHDNSQQNQEDTTQFESTATTDASVVELNDDAPVDDNAPVDDDASAELDTETTLGLSVAILMGKSIPKHKNIFDLMDSTASSWIKRSLGKQSQSSIELERKKNEMLLLAAQQQEIDASIAAERLLQENNSLSMPLIEKKQTPQPIAVDIGVSDKDKLGDHSETCLFPPISPEKSFHALKRERRGAKSPTVLHNHAIKETMKLKFGQLRMGEGRFSFDDVAVSTKEQLICNLRQKGDKTDLKELQKESQSKLREILKERLENESHLVKYKSESNPPFFRIEQILSKRAPEPKCPSPETIAKWHAAAKKAGVPMEALTKSQTNFAGEDTTDAVNLENASMRSEAKLSIPRLSETKAKPAANLIPRIVNPDHMELLLSQSSPKLYTQHSIAVSVQMPSRTARNEILWKLLCALE
jgi:hypothetical protein